MQIARYIDHTLLRQDSTKQEVASLCREAELWNCAGVCVAPYFVELAKTFLIGSRVKVATVIGFPFGYSSAASKAEEIRSAIHDGCDELDVVINVAALKSNDWLALNREIDACLDVVRQHQKLIKVIIESGILTGQEIISCCDLYGAREVNFIKTSTGFAASGASVEAVELIRKNIPESIGIKASGGIRNYTFAKELIAAGATRLGCSATGEIIKEEKTANA